MKNGDRAMNDYAVSIVVECAKSDINHVEEDQMPEFQVIVRGILPLKVVLSNPTANILVAQLIIDLRDLIIRHFIILCVS